MRRSITARASHSNRLSLKDSRPSRVARLTIDSLALRLTMNLFGPFLTPMNDAIRKADVLIEALGYIRTFRNRLIVIKLGGSAMEDADALRATLQDVVFMETVGMRPVLVHGGGKPIDRAMTAAGLQPRKVQGRRYTDDATLAIVVRVLCEEINTGIVQQIRELGGRAVGLHTGALQVLFGERLLLPGAG